MTAIPLAPCDAATFSDRSVDIHARALVSLWRRQIGSAVLVRLRDTSKPKLHALDATRPTIFDISDIDFINSRLAVIDDRLAIADNVLQVLLDSDLKRSISFK